MIACHAVHLAGKRAGRDRGHIDGIVHKPRRHAPGQVDERRFRGVVTVGFLRIQPDAIDRRDVDDLGRLFTAAGRLQQVMQGLGQEERRFDVEVHHLVPATFRKRLERRAPGGARVVDENIEPGFERGKLRGQCLAAGDG